MALFEDKVQLDAVAVVNASGTLDADGLTNKEIADLIANQEKSHFFSNYCFSCRSESTAPHDIELAGQRQGLQATEWRLRR